MRPSLAAQSQLVIATHNAGKLAEFETLFKPFDLVPVGAAALGLAEPEEDGTSFAENALLKARLASQATGLPALGDDSGLCVAALNGAPGIYSARWAGQPRDFAVAMGTVWQRLADKPDRRAFFIAVLALVLPDGQECCFEGRVEGHISWPMRGDNGFGYDPIFVAQGYDTRFAELDPAFKDQISHRARAFRAFAEACLPSL